MKTLLITLLSLCIVGYAETADELARRAITQFALYDNGLDQSPEGRRKTALNNADFHLANYMASDAVPEKIRLAYALRELRGQLHRVINKGTGEVDTIETEKMKERVRALIQLLEARFLELSIPEKPVTGK